MIALVATLVLIGPLAGTAYAADELGVSRDGRTWSDRLPGSLFDPSVRWVPGDTRTESFFVRNRASDRGELRIQASSSDPDRLLRDDEVSIRVRIGNGAWQALDGGARSVRIDEASLGAGEQARVTVRAAFAPTSGNRTQRDSLALHFVVTLTDASAGDGGEGDDEDGGGLLPDTGTEVAGWTVVLAAMSAGAGLALMRRGSRRGEEAADGATT